MVILTATPAWADGVRDKQWHLPVLHAAEAQAISQGDGIIVAVIDSGVEATHPDLVGNVLPGVDLTGGTGDGSTDTHGHGTAMASDIAGHGHGDASGVLGLAPKAKILPVRIATGASGGDLGTGMHWAVDHGAKILNVSRTSADLSSVREATDYALAKGAIVVAGTGNEGATVGAPAMYPGVIAVSGLDKAGALWASSNRGRETVLAAPAVDITSARNGNRYAMADGTSDATALVSATAALIWSQYRQLDANNVINRLISTADDKGVPGRDDQYGFGAVNPYRALTENVPSVSTNPLVAQTSSSTPSAVPDLGTPTGNPADDYGPSRGTYLAIIGVPIAVVLGVLGVVVAVFVRRRRRAARAQS
ncbi:S8 family serine peptidase [Longispora fulva]|uniref:Type VII secretion-associated serine protease mycosin n=1 Tax=Longispora fulva TaxID=619741 RepID=A0A8J7GGY2_9ACTN|nr:S8 family serine peptidase [Longispora fulva]MBG6136522.1 type VII secretion-associated serine protease mycosin [Longispora fulva]